jgi:hypothetical protein
MKLKVYVGQVLVCATALLGVVELAIKRGPLHSLDTFVFYSLVMLFVAACGVAAAHLFLTWHRKRTAHK